MDKETCHGLPPSRAKGGYAPGLTPSRARRAIARGGPALSSFRNLNRDERFSDESRSVLVTVDKWLSTEVAPDALPERRRICVLGVDLGGSRSMSAAATYWPESGRLEAIGTFPGNPGLADRGAADGVGDRYGEMRVRGELSVLGEATVPPGPWLASVMRLLDGAEVASIVGDRLHHAEFSEAMQAAGIRASFVWRGFGWKDGAEDIERFRRALFDGDVKVRPSLLLRSAFADAVTMVDPAGNHKLAKGRALGRIHAAAATVLAVAEGARLKARRQTQREGGMGVKRYDRHSAAVLRSSRWPALRMQAKRRDGWRCVRCGATTGLEVDHIRPVRTHPELGFDLGNLQTLCGRCHGAKTRPKCGHQPVFPERQQWRDLLRMARREPIEQQGDTNA